jgi:hypothetical protein
VEPIRKATERGTIPQRKGGHTEDTEKEKYSLPAMLAQKMVSSVSSFYLCDLCGIVTQFPKNRISGFSYD